MASPHTDEMFVDYSHANKQQYRCGIIVKSQLVASFYIMPKGEIDQQSWLETLLKQPITDNLRRGILTGTSPEQDLGENSMQLSSGTRKNH